MSKCNNEDTTMKYNNNENTTKLPWVQNTKQTENVVYMQLRRDEKEKEKTEFIWKS